MFFLFHRRTKKIPSLKFVTSDEVETIRVDRRQGLVLGIGKFTVTAGGVEATINPPLDRLSRHYGWRELPFSLSVIKTLVDGEDGNVLGLLTDRLGLSIKEMRMLELEHVDARDAMTGSEPEDLSGGMINRDDLVQDTGVLIDWSTDLARRCPYSDISKILRTIPKMDTKAMDRYVGRFLMG